MTDLKEMLGLALDDAPAAAHADAPLGVDGDLARGQRLLRRRTRGRMLGASAAVAAVAVAVAVPALTSGPNTKPAVAASQPAPAGAAPSAAPADASHPAATGIRLVAYTGTQPPGYVVKVIPDNWVIQGSTPLALTIAPANAANKDPDYFLGKLVVTQESFDTSSAQSWTSARVPGHTASLVIEQTPSRWLLVQAPTGLHWTEQQEVQFGLGVTILSTAQEGKG